MWRNARCALPSLSVTRGGEAEEQALCETERKGETQKRVKGERGKYCCEEERRANNQGFWMRVRVFENTWGRTRSITQRHGAAVREEGLPEVLLLLLLPVLRRPVLYELEHCAGQSQRSGGYTTRRKDGIFRQDAGSEFPGSRVFCGGAGRETLQEDESV